jgi:hypothetical protein
MKKQMTSNRKLKLEKHTIRTLHVDAMGDVVGGAGSTMVKGQAMTCNKCPTQDI